MNDHVLDFKSLQLGVASAATQIEGDETNTNWYRWYTQGKIHDNSSPDITDKHWELWKQDALLMESLGIKYARIGLEWARIEPKPHEFSLEALKRYKEELELLKSKNIKVLVTLWHFSNPLWFEDEGGFLNPQAPELFREYAEKVIIFLGKDIESWITLNEPNVYALNSYMGGDWPPGHNSIPEMLKIMNTFVTCHIDTYKLIHQYYPHALVGTALHVRAFVPLNQHNPWHRFATKMSEKVFQSSLAIAMNTGKKAFPYKGNTEGKYYDFIGLNYYSRSTCKGLGDGTKKNTPKNDLNWEIYPEGLTQLCKQFYDKYQAPLFITENGTCDNQDKFRSRYIYEHLKAVLASGVPVTRYYHWCFIDNWEWLEGMSMKFGIVNIDPKTLERTVKESGKFYQQMIKDEGVSEKAYEQYVAHQQYPIR